MSRPTGRSRLKIEWMGAVPSLEVIRQHYALHVYETHAGGTISAAARRLGVSRTTARTLIMAAIERRAKWLAAGEAPAIRFDENGRESVTVKEVRGHG